MLFISMDMIPKQTRGSQKMGRFGHSLALTSDDGLLIGCPLVDDAKGAVSTYNFFLEQCCYPCICKKKQEVFRFSSIASHHYVAFLIQY